MDAAAQTETPDILRSIPRELKDMTDEQYWAYVRFLAGKGLPDIRRRQAIVKSQQGVLARKTIAGTPLAPHEDLASRNLETLDGLLLRAVWTVSFKDPPPPR